MDRYRVLGIRTPGIEPEVVLDKVLAEAGIVALDTASVVRRQQAILDATYKNRYPRWRRIFEKLISVSLGAGIIAGLIMVVVGFLSSRYTIFPGVVTVSASFLIFAVYFIIGAPYYHDYAGRWSAWSIERWCYAGRDIPTRAVGTATQIAHVLPAASFCVVAHSTNSDPFLKVVFCGAERYLAEWEEVPIPATNPASVLTPVST